MSVAVELERVDGSALSAAEFSREFVEKSRPCVLLDAQRGWPAASRWTPSRLVRKTRGQAVWRVADRSDGAVDLESFLAICTEAAEASSPAPPCIFDSRMSDVLSADYVPPAAVESGSLFSLVEGAPVHKWIIIGGIGSGTQLHVDPLATCAWNALVFGSKRWALLPPRRECIDSADEHVAEEMLSASARLPAKAWFLTVLPQLKSESWRGPALQEVVQVAGETLFVPEGWRHAVLNLETTIAVTHNVAHPHALERIIPLAQEAAPVFAARLLQKLSSTFTRNQSN